MDVLLVSSIIFRNMPFTLISRKMYGVHAHTHIHIVDVMLKYVINVLIIKSIHK